LLAGYSDFSVEQKRDALNALASRPSYATQLLAAVRDNRIARDQLSADLVRQLRNLNDPDLTQQIEQVWGVVRDTPEERLKLIAEYRSLLESPPAVEPDRELGRAIFAKTCQQCHILFGTGGNVGPDITGANRSQLDYLLHNILDPSAVMAKEYRPSVIATEDGRVITGIVKEETDSQVTVQTANEVVTLTPDEVAARKESEKSMMPEDQLTPFSQHEVRSLFAYLSGAGQTPLLATPENVTTFFNGENLDGWIGAVAGRESAESPGGATSGLWSVENGEIVGRSSGLDHNEFLVSQLSLSDFRFACQVKLVDNAGNSGIQIRSMPQSNGEVRGYQCDIGAGWWGKLYEELGRGLLVDNDAEQHVKPGKWNHYEIVAVGSRVQTRINGQPCVDYSDPAGARRGVIAFQLHSGGPTEVRFRQLELTLLEPNPLETVTGEYPVTAAGPATGAITWKKTQLDDKFRGEGVAIADFNNDGVRDIASGSVWFENREGWPMRSVLEQPAEFKIDGYSESFMNWPEDLNSDGWLDLIVVDFPGEQTWWFENPAGKGGAWKRHQITPVTNNESPQYVDVDGDGRREIVFGGENGLMSLASPKSFPDAPWNLLPISIPGSPGTERFSHGLGIGDLNADGRKDVLIPNGWWEQPEDPTLVPWTFHEAPFGQPCSQMYVFDYDGDGDADVLSASPHDFGVWWHEQRLAATQQGSAEEDAEPSWITHEIDKEYSETHAVVLADINGDGLPDFVTGKRWWSHNGHGPGADGPAVLYWYELQRVDGKPEWTRHEIDTDSGVGTEFTVADINGDGLLDIATSNKKGTFVFEQVRD
jgi:putative heme-binding domain-containing protein